MEDIPEFAVPFDPTKRKKKKKVVVRHAGNGLLLTDHLNDRPADDKREEEGISQLVKCPWEGSDRDYHYQELLHRAYDSLNESNPELAGNGRSRTFMKPVQVIQEGNMSTVVVNFTDLCNIMHRQPDQVMAFMLGKIKADGYLDEHQRLIVKGGFLPKSLEEILRRYIDEYVMCSTCRSPDTILSGDRLQFFLGCEQCGSERSVAPINSSVAAQTRQKRHLKTRGA